jgi:Uma2 family endonuclease
MSLGSLAPFTEFASPLPRRSNVVIEDKVCLPPWVDDLATFRRWTASDEFPTQGSFAFLNSDIWVDLSMEELITHNQVKAEFTFLTMSILHRRPLGRYVPDRMYLTNIEANLSTEPDGLFYLYSTIQAGRLRLIEKAEVGIIELEGSPDMTLEIVSKTSVRKDTVVLKELYWKAKIPEYWLVDVRPGHFSFDILVSGAERYEAAAVRDGWIRSPLFGLEFSLREDVDPVGKRLFRVDVREPLN